MSIFKKKLTRHILKLVDLIMQARSYLKGVIFKEILQLLVETNKRNIHIQYTH